MAISFKMSNLYVNVPEFSLKTKVLQYNVDMAMREEAHEATKWANRSSRVKSLIKDVDADIVCLQEMRRLPENPSINRFLAEFDDYRFQLEYRNSSALSFGQAILYKPEKYYPLKSVKYWLSATPDVVSDTYAVKAGGTTGFGYIVFGLKFLPMVDGKIVENAKPLWVFNTHFGLEEDLKTQSCHQLLKIINKEVDKDNFVVCGDFNFFPDRDGGKQRAILTEHWQDLGQGAKTLGGRSVEGTFVGYDHDAFKADLNNMISRLDHIFSSQCLTGVNPTLYTKTMLPKEPKELTTRDYPSDHLPLVIEIQESS